MGSWLTDVKSVTQNKKKQENFMVSFLSWYIRPCDKLYSYGYAARMIRFPYNYEGWIILKTLLLD